MTEVRCAVCGLVFEEGSALDLGASFMDWKGQRYWFCSPACDAEFRIDPRRYE